MTNQSATNVLAAVKREVTFGTPAASGAGAHVIPTIDSPGIKQARTSIESGRRPRNQIRRVPRLGSRSVAGTYNTEMLPGGAIDLFLESLARGTWSPALALTAVSITTTASTIIRAAGDWLTAGIRRGDIITITLDTTAANNNLRLRVVSVTATTITVAGTPLTPNATSRSVTVTRLKKVIAPASPVYHSYTIEQYDVDIDESELFVGQRLTSGAFSMRPDAHVTAAWGFTGRNRHQRLDTAAAPYFTSPTELTDISLVADDGWIRYNGVDVAVATGLDLTFTIASGVQPVIGSPYSPDVFMNDMTITGQLTAIRDSLLAIADWDAETRFEIQATLVAPGADPKAAIGIYLPSVKIMDIDAPFLGGDTAKIETRAIAADAHAGSADTDATAVAFYSTGA